MELEYGRNLEKLAKSLSLRQKEKEQKWDYKITDIYSSCLGKSIYYSILVLKITNFIIILTIPQTGLQYILRILHNEPAHKWNEETEPGTRCD